MKRVATALAILTLILGGCSFNLLRGPVIPEVPEPLEAVDVNNRGVITLATETDPYASIKMRVQSPVGLGEVTQEASNVAPVETGYAGYLDGQETLHLTQSVTRHEDAVEINYHLRADKEMSSQGIMLVVDLDYEFLGETLTLTTPSGASEIALPDPPGTSFSRLYNNTATGLVLDGVPAASIEVGQAWTQVYTPSTVQPKDYQIRFLIPQTNGTLPAGWEADLELILHLTEQY